MSERKVQKFDIAYSLGCTCAPALYMRSLMMRFASGPFDWLAGGNFETRIHAIETDFCDFMREQDLELRERDFGFDLTFAHDYYHNVHNDLRHYHDFKTGIPLVETYPAVMEKYQRRMKRFIGDLANKRTLLIWYALEQTTSDETILACCNKIIDRFGKNVHFLIVEHAECDGVEYKRLGDNIERFTARLQVLDKNGHVKTMGDSSKMTKILKGYAVRNSRSLYLRKQIKRTLVRISTLFIPIKSVRRKVRRKLYNENALDWN